MSQRQGVVTLETRYKEGPRDRKVKPAGGGGGKGVVGKVQQEGRNGEGNTQ